MNVQSSVSAGGWEGYKTDCSPLSFLDVGHERRLNPSCLLELEERNHAAGPDRTAIMYCLHVQAAERTTRRRKRFMAFT